MTCLAWTTTPAQCKTTSGSSNINVIRTVAVCFSTDFDVPHAAACARRIPRTAHRTIFSSHPRCPASHVTATRGTIDKPVTMYSMGTGKLLAAVVVAVAVLAGVAPCASAGRVQRTRYVEGVSQMYFPRFHIRTDGRPGWLIESMKCTTHGGVPVQLAPCPNSASGTCYMVTNKVQP